MSFQSPFRRFLHLLSFVSGEGGWRLYPHEQAVVDAASGDLPTEFREQVSAQLEQPFFVERSSKQVSVLRFYKPDSRLAIADAAFNDRLVKVRIEIDGRKQEAHVTFYKGYIFSVEFKKPRKFYVGKQITICDMSQGKPDESYTRALDRLEHGRSEYDEQ